MKRVIKIVLVALLLYSPTPLLQVRAQFNTDRITAIGRNALYFDDYVLSIQYFNQVIKLKPYLAEPYLLRSVAKVQLGDLQGALGDVNKAIELNPFNAGYFYTRGFIYRQLNQLDKALNDFSQALFFSPQNRIYLSMRADIYARQEQYDLAKKDIDFLLHREPQSASLLYEKGVICVQQKDTACALDCFSQTIVYDSQNPANWSALGMIHSMLHQDDEAISDLSNAIKLGSQWAGDYINRGIIYYRKHNYRNAMADYDKAIELAPNDPQVYYNRGVLRQELGDKNNALLDFDKALALDPSRPEYVYQKAVTLMELKQWKQAVSCFDELIASHPYFLPSYYLAAQAKTALGEGKAAYKYRQTAYELEQQSASVGNHQDSIQQSTTGNSRTIHTGVTVAQSQPKTKDHRKEFSSRAAQNQLDEANRIGSDTRGSIQNRYVDVINEPNFSLSYYHPQSTIHNSPSGAPSTNYTHSALDIFNRQRLLPAPLYVSLQDLALTADMVNQHFDRINRLSERLERELSADAFLTRAMEFSLVQDYSSAIDDCTRALQLINGSDYHSDETEAILTFCRANWRYRLYEYQRSAGELTVLSPMDYEIMLRDYDHTLQLLPDFSFAYYNKANILCTQKEFEEAIRQYTKAIECDNDFAEAYFNRGLTYIFLGREGDHEKGLADLSKAGELGIYQAYNLLTRFK